MSTFHTSAREKMIGEANKDEENDAPASTIDNTLYSRQSALPHMHNGTINPHPNPYDNNNIVAFTPDPRLNTDDALPPQYNTNTTILVLLIASSLSMLIFTVIPVIVKFPYITSWFASSAVYRFIDPLVTLPLNYFLLVNSEVFLHNVYGKKRFLGLSEKNFIALLFMMSAAIYVQFHGVHTASAMFKHPVEQFNDDHPELVQQFPVLYDIYLWMEDIWEHKIAHYLYAFGGACMIACQLYAYRAQVHQRLTGGQTALWGLAVLIYALIVAGVAIEFPGGQIVGLVYSALMAVVIGLYTYLSGGLFTRGRRLVLQTLLMAYILAFVIVVIYTIAVGGFKNRKSAGLFVR
ncbi:uncharacterized protein VTP21DRAFT_5238 [Calcarisporiella thermophila]|uniref:uncharacterized protein n=1 Tax=Calcarisporiella thermophila TaxID=911321 RepID=UPI0037438105